jgi:spermidine synthase
MLEKIGVIALFASLFLNKKEIKKLKKTFNDLRKIYQKLQLQVFNSGDFLGTNFSNFTQESDFSTLKIQHKKPRKQKKKQSFEHNKQASSK